MRNSDERATDKFIYSILCGYNELAVGINEGLYDELYVKMAMGNDMRYYYRHFRPFILMFSKQYDTEQLFLPLELLLSRWDRGDVPSYKFNYHRRVR